MTLEEALERADRLCPPNHPSGKLVLYTVDTRKRRPLADRNQQLDSADALGVLAAEVRRLQAEPIYARMVRANALLRAELARVEQLISELRQRAHKLRVPRRSAKRTAQGEAFNTAADDIEQALRSNP